MHQSFREKQLTDHSGKVGTGSREEIVYRANNVIAKLSGVGKLRM
jgi:hypothetical protein